MAATASLLSRAWMIYVDYGLYDGNKFNGTLLKTYATLEVEFGPASDLVVLCLLPSSLPLSPRESRPLLSPRPQLSPEGAENEQG